MSGTISNTEYKNLRNEFREYLRQTATDRTESAISTIWSDTFFILNNNITIDFWECLTSEEGLLRAQIKIKEFLEGKQDNNPEQRAKGYASSMGRLKEFLDRDYPNLAKNWSGKTIQTEEQVSTINYSLVSAEHIREALDYIAQKGTPTKRLSRTRYIVYKDNKFAPKWVFAVAYSIATSRDKRRWDMELVRNKFNDKDHGFVIEGTGITWREFAIKVNEILAKQDGIMSSEDKSLGAWFIRPNSADGKAISSRHFANKVLKYLWDDAFKFDRKTFFNTDKYNTLEQVIAGFETLKTENGFGELLREFASKDKSVTEAEVETK